MKKYEIIERNENRDCEDVYNTYTDLKEAIKVAKHLWEKMCQADKKHNVIEVRTYVPNVFDYDVELRLAL